jgi:hypothetical protein
MIAELVCQNSLDSEANSWMTGIIAVRRRGYSLNPLFLRVSQSWRSDPSVSAGATHYLAVPAGPARSSNPGSRLSSATILKRGSDRGTQGHAELPSPRLTGGGISPLRYCAECIQGAYSLSESRNANESCLVRPIFGDESPPILRPRSYSSEAVENISSYWPKICSI